MNSSDDDHNSLERRERLLQEREVELRLQQLETEINYPQQKAAKKLPRKPQESGAISYKKAVLAVKLLAFGGLTFFAITMGSFLSASIIIITLMFVAYKLFFNSAQN